VFSRVAKFSGDESFGLHLVDMEGITEITGMRGIEQILVNFLFNE